MYASFVKHISLPFYEWVHGSDFFRNLRSFERSQWLSQEQLQTIQWSRLKKLLYHAYRNVPYYQEKFKILGAVPEDIKSFEDFKKFPTLKKQTLQERLSDLIASNVPRMELLKGMTSGSSGQPTCYYQEVSSNKIRGPAGRRLTRIAGYDFGLKLFLFWRVPQLTFVGDKILSAGEELTNHKNLLMRMKKALYDRFAIVNPTIRLDPTLLTEYEMARIYERLKAFRPDIIISYVNALYMFARYLDSEHLTNVRPRSIIVSSETLHPNQRELIEKVFGCRVYNRYGLQETGIVAIECPMRQGLHLNQEILHVEYIPNMDSKLQLVITDLINYGMPLLRYETGDTARPVEGPCHCGRGLSRIGEIEGRIIDLLPTQRGGFVNGQLFATFHWIKGIKQYQVIQEKIDSFRIKIVPTAVFEGKYLSPMLDTIRDKFGSETSIKIEYVETIPFTNGGKYKLVVSEIKDNST